MAEKVDFKHIYTHTYTQRELVVDIWLDIGI